MIRASQKRSPLVFTEEQIAHLTSIVEKLDRHPVCPEAVSRRRSPRINIRTTIDAMLLAIENRPLTKIFSRDLSTSGIGFVSRRLFKAGERFVLIFPVKNEKAKLVLAEITFCKYAAGGVHQAGAQFRDCVHGEVEEIPAHWGV